MKICTARSLPWFLAAALSLIWCEQSGAQTTNVAVAPEADTFVRALASSSNYGGAGSISVSGAAATNGSGQQNGLFDSLLRFPTSTLVASIDGAFGTYNWIVTGATLQLFETGAPANTLFNRGVGAFEIRWLASDNWIEGTGTPAGPTTDGITYSNLASLTAAGEVSLGQFTNRGLDGTISFSLGLGQLFVSDIRSGGPVSLHLTAASPQVGFTADSRSFGTASARPSLVITAVKAPSPQLLIITAQPNQVSLAFDTVSNWNYTLQGTSAISSAASGWSNLATYPAQATNAHIVFSDGITNQVRFYRLSFSP